MSTEQESDSVLLARRAADWRAGALTGRDLDRRLALALTPAQRLAEGIALVRVAAKIQRGVDRR